MGQSYSCDEGTLFTQESLPAWPNVSRSRHNPLLYYKKRILHLPSQKDLYPLLNSYQQLKRIQKCWLQLPQSITNSQCIESTPNLCSGGGVKIMIKEEFHPTTLSTIIENFALNEKAFGMVEIWGILDILLQVVLNLSLYSFDMEEISCQHVFVNLQGQLKIYPRYNPDLSYSSQQISTNLASCILSLLLVKRVKITTSCQQQQPQNSYRVNEVVQFCREWKKKDKQREKIIGILVGLLEVRSWKELGEIGRVVGEESRTYQLMMIADLEGQYCFK